MHDSTPFWIQAEAVEALICYLFQSFLTFFFQMGGLLIRKQVI